MDLIAVINKTVVKCGKGRECWFSPTITDSPNDNNNNNRRYSSLSKGEFQLHASSQNLVNQEADVDGNESLKKNWHNRN